MVCSEKGQQEKFIVNSSICHLLPWTWAVDIPYIPVIGFSKAVVKAGVVHLWENRLWASPISRRSTDKVRPIAGVRPTPPFARAMASLSKCVVESPCAKQIAL